MSAEFIGLLAAYLAVLLAVAPFLGGISARPWKTRSPG